MAQTDCIIKIDETNKYLQAIHFKTIILEIDQRAKKITHLDGWSSTDQRICNLILRKEGLIKQFYIRHSRNLAKLWIEENIYTKNDDGTVIRTLTKKSEPSSELRKSLDNTKPLVDDKECFTIGKALRFIKTIKVNYKRTLRTYLKKKNKKRE